MGTVIKHVKLVLPKGKIIRGTIKWDKGKIVSVSEGEILSSVEDQVIDGMDLYLFLQDLSIYIRMVAEDMILWMGQLRPF